MQKKWMSLSFIILLLVVSGCQNNRGANEEEAYDLRTDPGAPNYMSNRGNDRNEPKNMNNRNQNKANNTNRDGNNFDTMDDRDKNQQHQVEDDITNQNPNFLDLHRTGSGGEAGATNQGNDINKAKQVVKGTNEFETDSVWINGDRMWVSVYKKGMLSGQGKIDAEARLHRKLVQALPRYNIEVRVQEDRR